MQNNPRTKQRKTKTDEPQAWPDFAQEVAPGKLAFGRIYWTNGQSPKGSRLRNEVSDPPNSGWSHAFILPQGGRRVRVFCPYTLNGYTITSDSAEFDSLTTPNEEFKPGWAVKLITEKWKQFDGYGFQRDFDTAARVLRELGAEIPVKTASVDGNGNSGDGGRKGGKDAAAKLLKPVQKDSRRGQLLSWFMDSLESRSVREAMAEFDTTRSNVLTMLFQLNKDHGIGYTLQGDAASVELPPMAKGQKLFG